jgi:hypothetical protein
MARKTLEQRHKGFHTVAVPSAFTPTTCPLCDHTPEGVKGKNGYLVLQAHLKEKHYPGTPCRREYRSDERPEYRLDWDAVLHQQPQIWFCQACGYYA